MFSTIPNVHIYAHALYGQGVLFCFPAYSMSKEYERFSPIADRIPYLYQQLQSLAIKSVTQTLLEHGTIIDQQFPHQLLELESTSNDEEEDMIPIIVIDAYHNSFQVSLERTNTIDARLQPPEEIWLNVPEQWDTYHAKEKIQYWMSQIRQVLKDHESTLQRVHTKYEENNKQELTNCE